MKRIIKLIIITLSIISVYFIIKIILLSVYTNTIIKEDTSLRRINRNLLFENATTNITHTYLEKPGDEYYQYKDIKFKNIVKDYEEIITDNNISFKENDNIKIIISKSDINLIDKLKKEKLAYNLTKDLKKANITDDIELMKYLVKNYNTKYSLLSSINTIRKGISINLAAGILPSNINSISKFDGDYDGYIIEFNNNQKEALIEYKKNYYHFIFNDCDYSLIYELLSSIVIGSNTDTPTLIPNEIISNLKNTTKIIINNDHDNKVYKTITNKEETTNIITMLSHSEIVRGPVTSDGTNIHMLFYNNDNIIYDFYVWHRNATFGLNGKDYRITYNDRSNFDKLFDFIK